MTQLDQLPPDQRAALSLLLRQGRRYEDVARLLQIEPETVRRRALAALAALGPRDTGALPDERRDEIGDYLLGQQRASRRGETREYLEESPPGRAWARVVGSELRPLAAGALPEIPGEGFERDRPSPPGRDETRATPAPAARSPAVPRRAAPAAAETPGALPPARAAGEGRRRPGRSGPAAPAGFGRAGGPPASAAAHSRVGRAVLLMGLGVIVAALIILIVEGVIFGGGGSSSSDNATLASSASSAASTSTPTTTSTTTSSATSSTPRIVAQIPFAPTSHGGRAAAVANVAQSGNQKAFALVAQGLAPTKGFAYAVWLYNPGANAEPLGFIDQRVGADGRVTAEGVLPGNETRFKQIVITQETASKPTRPGTIVLVGQLNP